MIVLGGGVVGINAAIIALGLQADVWVLDTSVDRMRELEIALDGRVTLAMSNRLQVEEVLPGADLVIGAVLVPGARAPKLVTRDMLGLMRPHAVLVDVAIDQGGCFETSHATTHDDPVFVVDDIVHYCVANMPERFPSRRRRPSRTSLSRTSRRSRTRGCHGRSSRIRRSRRESTPLRES